MYLEGLGADVQLEVEKENSHFFLKQEKGQDHSKNMQVRGYHSSRC